MNNNFPQPAGNFGIFLAGPWIINFGCGDVTYCLCVCVCVVPFDKLLVMKFEAHLCCRGICKSVSL